MDYVVDIILVNYWSEFYMFRVLEFFLSMIFMYCKSSICRRRKDDVCMLKINGRIYILDFNNWVF